MRSGGSLSASAELMWKLLPPRTFATDRLVVTALLEPWDRVAGDAYDYAVNAGDAFFAVFDGAGHDLQAGHDNDKTALAVLAGLRRLSLSAPHDLDVVGVDDVPAAATRGSAADDRRSGPAGHGRAHRPKSHREPE